MWVVPENELKLLKSINVTDSSGVTRPYINITVRPDEDVPEEKLSFTWKPTKMTERELEVQVDFKNPSDVSMSGIPDFLDV